MKIKIDGKEIVVTDTTKNIVDIGIENGINIIAPCYKNKRKQGCCKACLIEIDGEQKYACATQPEDGMNIIYNRKDLDIIRKQKLEKYAKAIKNNKSNNSCCCSNSNCCN